jgi:hypothetical protein
MNLGRKSLSKQRDCSLHTMDAALSIGVYLQPTEPSRRASSRRLEPENKRRAELTARRRGNPLSSSTAHGPGSDDALYS